jgi:hypothetical protein
VPACASARRATSARSAASDSRRASASATSTGSGRSTRRPPSPTTSGTEVAATPTTGQAQAIASTNVKPKPSKLDGLTITSDAPYSSTRSSAGISPTTRTNGGGASSHAAA